MQIHCVKLLGRGLAVAALFDALLVRMLLIPRLMLLFGDLQWAQPGPLRRLHARFGSKESADVQTPDKVSA
jgi:putative drug exporter of the RND superfamily